MTIDPISLYPLPTFYPIDRDYKLPESYVVKKNQEKYYRDTLAPQMVQLVMPQQTINPLPEFNGMRPKLEAPSFEAKKLQTFSSNDNHHLIQQTEKKEKASDDKEELRDSEYHLQSAVMQCFVNQKSLSEEQSLLIFNGIKKKQEENKLLGQQYFSQMDELIERAKTSESLTWVSWAMTGAVIAGGFASIAITWGTSIPAVFASWISIGNALAGVAAGGMTITQGVYDYVTNLMRGQMLELEYSRQHQDQKINIGMEEMKNSTEVVAELMQQMIEILNNQYQASIMK